MSEKKKAYTTTTKRKSFGELFWPQRETFQAGGGYKNPTKTRKKTFFYHRNPSSMAPCFIRKLSHFGHFLRGRSLKGRCNIRVYVPVCVPVCVCPSSPPHNPTHAVGLNNRIPPTPIHDPSPPFPHPYPQAIA